VSDAQLSEPRAVFTLFCLLGHDTGAHDRPTLPRASITRPFLHSGFVHIWDIHPSETRYPTHLTPPSRPAYTVQYSNDKSPRAWTGYTPKLSSRSGILRRSGTMFSSCTELCLYICLDSSWVRAHASVEGTLSVRTHSIEMSSRTCFRRAIPGGRSSRMNPKGWDINLERTPMVM